MPCTVLLFSQRWYRFALPTSSADSDHLHHDSFSAFSHLLSVSVSQHARPDMPALCSRSNVAHMKTLGSFVSAWQLVLAKHAVLVLRREKRGVEAQSQSHLANVLHIGERRQVVMAKTIEHAKTAIVMAVFYL